MASLGHTEELKVGCHPIHTERPQELFHKGTHRDVSSHCCMTWLTLCIA